MTQPTKPVSPLRQRMIDDMTLRLVQENKIGDDELVVCIVSGSGLKDVANAQKTAGKPLTIDPSVDAIRITGSFD